MANVDWSVTVFSSSVALEAFLDSVEFENLRKRQQTENDNEDVKHKIT